MLLRDIIDLEATYAAAHGGIVDNSQIVLNGGAPPPSTAPITAKKLAEAEKRQGKSRRPSPSRRVRDEDVDEVELERQKQAEAEAAEAEDEFDDGGAMSMSAMEAELREGVTKTLDAVGENFVALSQAAGAAGRAEDRGQGPHAEGLQGIRRDRLGHHREPEDAAPQQCAYRNAGRAAVRDQQAADPA